MSAIRREKRQRKTEHDPNISKRGVYLGRYSRRGSSYLDANGKRGISSAASGLADMRNPAQFLDEHVAMGRSIGGCTKARGVKKRLLAHIFKFKDTSGHDAGDLDSDGEEKGIGGADDDDEESEDDDPEEMFETDEKTEAGHVGDPILMIRKIKTRKDKIKNPPLAEQNLIPRLGTSSIMNGTTGQGKSTLLTNIIRSPKMFGQVEPKPIFDFKFLVSPTAEGDDVQKRLGIKKQDTFTNLAEAPDIIRSILDAQKEMITEHGNDKAPQVLLIYDDVISDPLFMRTDEFTKSFIASRHYNLTTFICSQSWTAVPRKCRLQAKNIFFFNAPLSEVDKLCEEYCPPGLNKKQFYKMVSYCCNEPYSFMYINKSVDMSQRFRKRLGEMLRIEYFARM